MKRILLPLLILAGLSAGAQTTTLKTHSQQGTIPSVVDTVPTYKLDEPTIIQISQLLAFGETAAGNSDKISTKDYNAYHAAVVHVDSVLRQQYIKFHPKETVKKP